MPRLPSIIAAVVMALPCAIASAQSDSTSTPAWAGRVDTLVEAQMRQHGIPGAQLAIAQNGRVIYSKGYGVADVESGRAVTPRTLFQVGSVAKTYTGMLLSELAAQGRLDLNAPISSVVPEMRDRATGNATPHQLLTHSAGWIDSAEPYGRTDDAALAEVVEQASERWVMTAPGRVYSYSNGGFAMAGYVAERAMGTPFLELMDAHVVNKVGLDHATYRPLVAMTRDFSQGHVEAPQGGLAVQRPTPSNSAEYPAGFLYVTASDMVRFGTTLMSGGTLDGRTVFSPKAIELLTGRYIPIPGTPNNRSGYGLQVGSVAGERVWRKGGQVHGFTSELAMWPDRRFTVAVSINRTATMMPSETNTRVAELVLGIPAPPAPAPAAESNGTPAQRAAIAGRYRIGDDTLEIAENAGRLEFRGRRGTFPVLFLDNERLVVKAPAPSGRVFTILRDQNGAVEYLHSHSRAFVKQKQDR